MSLGIVSLIIVAVGHFVAGPMAWTAWAVSLLCIGNAGMFLLPQSGRYAAAVKVYLVLSMATALAVIVHFIRLALHR